MADLLNWQVKRHKTIYSDPRYDAVGSSSLREELYAAYLKAQTAKATGSNTAAEPIRSADSPSGSKNAEETEEETKKRIRREKAEKATKEREEQVRREKDKVDRQIDRSKGNLTHEKAVEEFMTLLTDAIRDPTVSTRPCPFSVC